MKQISAIPLDKQHAQISRREGLKLGATGVMASILPILPVFAAKAQSTILTEDKTTNDAAARSVQLEVHEQVFPSDLGRGYLRLTESKKRRFISGRVKKPESADLSESDAFLSLDQDDYEKSESFSGNLNAVFSGGGGSLSVSVKRKLERSSTDVFFVIWKYAAYQKFSFEKDIMEDDIINKFGENKQEYINNYGDCYIRSVTTGGVMSIIYKFSFKTMKEASSFAMSGSVNYAGSSLDVASAQKEQQKSSAVRLSVKARISGVKGDPQVFGASDQEGLTTAELIIGKDNKGIKNILKYFDEFRDHVRNDGVAVPISYEIIDQNEADNGLLVSGELRERYAADAEARELARELENISEKLLFIGASLSELNPHVSYEELKAWRDYTEQSAKNLDGFFRQNDDVMLPVPELPFDAVKKFPDNWITGPLTEYKFEKFSLDWGGRRKADFPFSVPGIRPDGAPAKIEFRARYFPARGDKPSGAGVKIEIIGIRAENAEEKIANSIEFGFRSGHHDDTVSRKFEQIVYMPDDMRKVVLRARVSTGRLVVDKIVISR